MRLTVVVAMVTLFACRPDVVANSHPCGGVDRSLTTERKIAPAPILAKQLNVRRVEVLQSFALNGWSIVYVDTRESDEVFLFFSADPVASRYVTEWSGAATNFEENEIGNWTVKNAPGIPQRLAGCFAWHVTRDRDL